MCIRCKLRDGFQKQRKYDTERFAINLGETGYKTPDYTSRERERERECVCVPTTAPTTPACTLCLSNILLLPTSTYNSSEIIFFVKLSSYINPNTAALHRLNPPFNIWPLLGIFLKSSSLTFFHIQLKIIKSFFKRIDWFNWKEKKLITRHLFLNGNWGNC